MKGTYIFFARLDTSANIPVNRKGTCHRFVKGWYAYVGSAFNTGGLKCRLNRHYLGTGKKHWQIDFFRTGVIPHSKAWISCEALKLESLWAAVFQLMAGVSAPVIGFGNSDKRRHRAISDMSPTHLFYLNEKPRIQDFQKLLTRYCPACRPVEEIDLPL